jgi:hypothetical protein
VSVGEADTVARDTVYVRSVNARCAVATDVSVADIIGIDEYNVWLAWRQSEGGSAAGKRQEFPPVHQLLAYRLEFESNAAPSALRLKGDSGCQQYQAKKGRAAFGDGLK